MPHCIPWCTIKSPPPRQEVWRFVGHNRMPLIRSLDVGTINLALCDFEPETKTIRRWEVFPAPTIHKLFEALDQRPIEAHIVIEAQSKRSSKMLAVQHWLQAYYVLKQQAVTIYAACNKLKGTGHENRGRDNYAARKQAAVAICQAFLEATDQSREVMDFWLKTKKRDDCSDAALMAIAFAKVDITDVLPNVRLARINARRPTAKQLASGRFSKPNLKHLFLKEHQCVDAEALDACARKHPPLRRAMLRFWADSVACWEALQCA